MQTHGARLTTIKGLHVLLISDHIDVIPASDSEVIANHHPKLLFLPPTNLPRTNMSTPATTTPTPEQELAALLAQLSDMSKLALAMSHHVIHLQEKIPVVLQALVAAATQAQSIEFERGVAITPDELEARFPPGMADLAACEEADEQVNGVPNQYRKKKSSRREALDFYRHKYAQREVMKLTEVVDEEPIEAQAPSQPPVSLSPPAGTRRYSSAITVTGPKIWLGYLTLLTPRVFWGTLRVLFTLFGAFEVEGEYIWDKPVLCAVYRVLWDFWVDKPVLRAVYRVLRDFWVDKPMLRAVYGVLGDFWVDKPVLRAVYRVLWDFWVDKPVLCAVYRVLGDFWVDKPVLRAVYGVLGDFWVDKPVLRAVYGVLRDLMVDKS
ncbi:hypothetical protein C8F04DRAFT_1191986 [Mycena alexandri]|uniref:Uncharacterized protein n=1 Tax=Mycena alexandri TaxID=1745969 RepID=A0AAD6SDY0_9AGAR|nr:hypothetical protein C8F04DRAFT_1191986 [Mycena alexandri]